MNVYLIGIIFIGLFLRLFALGAYPFWYDEAVTVLSSDLHFSLPRLSGLFDPMIHSLRQDHLFIYDMVFIQYWKKLFGSSECILRLSSVFLGVLGIYTMYRLARLMYNRGTGLVASLLLALSPLHVYYSQELRPYTALFCCSTLGFYALYNIAVKGKNRYWIVYIIASVICVYINYMMLLFFAASTVVMFEGLVNKRIHVKAFFISNISIAFFILPVVMVVAANMANGFFKPLDPGLTEFPVWAKYVGYKNLLFTLKNFSIGYNTEFFSATGLFASLFLGFVFIRGIFKDVNRPRAYFNLILLFLPVLTIFLFSKFVRVCYVDRYFLPSLAIYAAAISYGLNLMSRKLTLVSIVVMSMLSFAGLKSYYYDILPRDYAQHIGIVHKNSHIDKLSKALSDNFEEGDRVYFTSKLLVYPAKFYVAKYGISAPGYMSGSSGVEHEVNEGKLLWIDTTGGLKTVYFDKIWPRAKVIEPFQKDDIGRVWLLNFSGDDRHDIISRFDESYIRRAGYDFSTAELYLYSSGK